jgi:hypothetical protein
MSKLYGLVLVSAVVAGCLVIVAAAEPKADKPRHSSLYRDFSAGNMVALCQNRFKFVRDKCGNGSRGIGIKWKGQGVQEDFKIFDLTGDLSDDQVKRVLGALQSELVKLARASNVVVEHGPKDSIADRPMRLLQPGLIWADTAVVPSRVCGFYFTYKEGKVEGAVDVLAIPMVKDKKWEWLVLGSVHEIAR